MTTSILSPVAPRILADRWRPAERGAAIAYQVALAIAGSLLLALSARVSFYLPFAPEVPVTAQTLAVVLVGALYGSRLGAATVALYLAQGAAGLPVFAAGRIGLPVFFGPTGGYLVGFLAGAWVVGALAERGFDRRLATSLAAMGAGLGAVFSCGVAGLAVWHLVLGMSPGVALTTALATGLLPFLPGEVLKLALAASLLPVGWSWLGRRGDAGPAASASA